MDGLGGGGVGQRLELLVDGLDERRVHGHELGVRHDLAVHERNGLLELREGGDGLEQVDDLAAERVELVDRQLVQQVLERRPELRQHVARLGGLLVLERVRRMEREGGKEEEEADGDPGLGLVLAGGRGLLLGVVLEPEVAHLEVAHRVEGGIHRRRLGEIRESGTTRAR